jgi:hypothetical protein
VQAYWLNANDFVCSFAIPWCCSVSVWIVSMVVIHFATAVPNIAEM